MFYLPYNKNLKEYARNLRKNSTPGEISLWMQVKASALGYQFYRQRIIDSYIVDFYCPAFKLVIEIDGNYHDYMAQAIADVKRQKMLERYGLEFLRFTEKEAMTEVGWVVEEIKKYIESRRTG